MTALDRVAVVSDVHGNLTAYQAVLADIDARGITRVVNLGDVVGKGPRGAECVRLTREREIATVQGNWEAFLSTGADGPAAWWWDQLDPDQRIWVAALPFHHDLVLSGRRVRMLHASPQGVFSRVSYLHSQEDYERMFLNTEHTGNGPEPSCVALRRHPRHLPPGRRQPDARQRRQRREPAGRHHRLLRRRRGGRRLAGSRAVRHPVRAGAVRHRGGDRRRVRLRDARGAGVCDRAADRPLPGLPAGRLAPPLRPPATTARRGGASRPPQPGHV